MKEKELQRFWKQFAYTYSGAKTEKEYIDFMTKAKKAHIYTVSGHGQQIKQRSFIVPENVYIHFWTEAGESLNDDLASRIERNPVFYLDQAIYTVRPGEFCPEHVLYDLDGLAKGYSWQNNVTKHEGNAGCNFGTPIGFEKYDEDLATEEGEQNG